MGSPSLDLIACTIKKPATISGGVKSSSIQTYFRKKTYKKSVKLQSFYGLPYRVGSYPWKYDP